MEHSLLTLGVAVAMMSALWPVSLILKDVSIADIFWGPGFALLALTALLAGGGTGPRGWLALALVTVWAVRLATHIALRWRKDAQEDRRYRAIREKYGARFPLLSLIVIFWLQAGLLWIVSWPLDAAIAGRGDLSVLDLIGAIVASAGILVEAVADAQLAAFRASPHREDRVLDTGLWRWTRHPNYFGDFLMWWGIFLIGFSGGAPWWTLLSPLVMSALLMRYSGAGLMEETITGRRPAYRAYMQRTSAFFPWPPK